MIRFHSTPWSTTVKNTVRSIQGLPKMSLNIQDPDR